MSKRAEEFSIKYADNKLAIVDKELSETNYHRHIKMGVHIFDGSDIEQAAMDGYEQAEKDLALTIDDLELLHTFIYAVKNNKQGCFAFTRLSNEQYEEVLSRFYSQREKK